MENKNYFIASKDLKNHTWIYQSDRYAFTEIDMINMIKICFVEGRNKSLGRKFLEIYRDTTQHKKDESEILLKNIGIEENGDREPTRVGNARTK